MKTNKIKVELSLNKTINYPTTAYSLNRFETEAMEINDNTPGNRHFGWTYTEVASYFVGGSHHKLWTHDYLAKGPASE